MKCALTCADARLYKDFYVICTMKTAPRCKICIRPLCRNIPNMRPHSARKFSNFRECDREKNDHSTIWKPYAILRHRMRNEYVRIRAIGYYTKNNNVTICWYLHLLLSACTILIVKCYYFRALYLLASIPESQVSEYILIKG